MKTCIIHLMAGLGCVLAGVAAAAPVGGPATQGQGKVAAGLEYTRVFRRDLDFRCAIRPPGHEQDQPENFRISGGNLVAGRVAYGVFDWLDLYARLGAAGYDMKGDVMVGDTRAVTEDLSARAALLWGAGLRLAREFQGGWILGLDAAYQASDHRLDFRAVTAAGQVVEATYGTCWMQEWHAAPFVARKIANWTPYLGARYSDFRLNQEDPDDFRRWDDLRFSAEHNLGLFAGADWNLGEHLRLNAEGRFLDETALSVSAACRF